MNLWRCEYTGEIIFGSKERGGLPLFGGWLPFFGWKRVPCHHDGEVDNVTWPPRYLCLKVGFSWFRHGVFYTFPNAQVTQVTRTTA